MDQVAVLTLGIKYSFQHNENAGIVFLDMNLLRTISDRHMVGYIVEKLTHRSFVLQLRAGLYAQNNEEWCPAGFHPLADAV